MKRHENPQGRCGTLLGLAIALAACVMVAMPRYAEGAMLRGAVYNAATGRPVEFASVSVVEARKKSYTDEKGMYLIDLAEKGVYTVIVRSEGLETYRGRVSVSDDTTRNVSLAPLTIRGKGLTITGKRDIQNVSRHTMTIKEIKEVPATFGDAINAITALPGIIRTGGDLFGPIVIRGGDRNGIRYLVDEIPVYSPLHYGGLHSVINSNLIDRIDVYASAFPAEIGSATSAVISLNTVDDVKEFGGYTDLSILSATALLQTSIIKNDGGKLALGSPLDERKEERKPAGYIIASGRSGYIDIIVLPLIQLITGERISIVPRYWDYQFKAKYYFNSSHSLTLFAMGSSDYFKLVNNKAPEDGSDPLLTGLRIRTDQQTHGQSLYYTYQPSESFRNRFTFYSSLRQNYISVNFPAPGVNQALQGLYVDSRPYIFGFSDKFKAEAVKKLLEIRGGAEYVLYYFTARGKTANRSGRDVTFDLTDENFLPMPLDERIINHLIGGYIETKITFRGLTVLPGFRTDHFKRSGESTWDPRLLVSYEFPTKTILSVAGGKYSYFFQTNPAYFDAYPQYAKIGKDLKSEWAFHRVAGIEQTLGLYKIKVEGFYNEFFDLANRYVHFGPDWSIRETMNTGKIRAWGAEILLTKDRKENQDDFFGWISYTYTRSVERSGLPHYPGLYGNPYNEVGDPWGNKWLNYDNEQNHSLKLILGYVFGKNSITGKFMLFSSSPYTPIVYSMEDIDYYNTTGQRRYYPVYGKPNSRHFPVNHRLDIRYSRTTNYSWGHLSWYIEVINVYNHRPIAFERWDYRLPYLGPKNPQRKPFSDSVAFIPNFGIEVKF